MSYFSATTTADRITFEGKEVTKIIPLRDRSSGVVTHFQLSVSLPEQGIDFRKFSVDEIVHLLECELLIVEKGYHGLARQTDRALQGTDEIFGAKRKQRARIDRITFLCRRMAHYCKMGMPLTPEGVEVRRPEAYFLRADCDEEMNPFISDHWRGIDTTIVLDRHKAEKKEPRKRSRRK